MPNYADMPSEQLLALVAQGDRDAFSCFMATHKDIVFSFSFRMLRNYEEAEDNTQEVFLKVWKSASMYKGNAKPSTWVLAIAANMCKNRLRSFWRRREMVDVEALDDFSADKPLNPDEQMIKDEQMKHLNSAIVALPVNQRIAIMFWRYENMSYSEIAEAMQCSVPNVEILLYRAKKTLIASLRGKD